MTRPGPDTSPSSGAGGDRTTDRLGRRQLLYGLGTLAATASLAGCRGSRTIEREARPVGIEPAAAADLGYPADPEIESVTTERTRETEDFEVEVTATSYVASYDYVDASSGEDDGSTVFAATPLVKLLGRTWNPIAREDGVADLLENRPEFFRRVASGEITRDVDDYEYDLHRVDDPRDASVSLSYAGDESSSDEGEEVDVYAYEYASDDADGDAGGYFDGDDPDAGVDFLGTTVGPADVTGLFVPAVRDQRLAVYYAAACKVTNEAEDDEVVVVHLASRGVDGVPADGEYELVGDGTGDLLSAEQVATFNGRLLKGLENADYVEAPEE